SNRRHRRSSAGRTVDVTRPHSRARRNLPRVGQRHPRAPQWRVAPETSAREIFRSGGRRRTGRGCQMSFIKATRSEVTKQFSTKMWWVLALILVLYVAPTVAGLGFVMIAV